VGLNRKLQFVLFFLERNGRRIREGQELKERGRKNPLGKLRKIQCFEGAKENIRHFSSRETLQQTITLLSWGDPWTVMVLKIY